LTRPADAVNASVGCTPADLPEVGPVDRITMRLRLPSIVGRERSWQIPRILGSFAIVVEPKTTRRMLSAVRAELRCCLQLVILRINL
jgi:hypothetical protein